jgi:hypothetical protein
VVVQGVCGHGAPDRDRRNDEHVDREVDDYGHAKVLDCQSTNEAAQLGSCTLGLAVY